MLSDVIRQGRERCAQDLLIPSRAVRDDRRGRCVRQTMAAQLAANGRDAIERHVKNYRLFRLRQAIPIELGLLNAVAAYKHARVSEIAMSQRDTRISAASDGCGDAGDDLIRDASAGQGF